MEAEKLLQSWNDLLIFFGHEGFNIQQVLLFSSLSLSALILESAILGYKKSSLYRLISFGDNSSRTDLISLIMGLTGLIKIAAAITTFGIGFWLSRWIAEQTGIDLMLRIESGPARDIIAFMLIDFLNYWRHWLSHKIQILWSFHKFHHSAKSLNMITMHRMHFLDAAYIGAFEGLIFLLIGYNQVMSYFWILIIRYVHSLFMHSQLDWGWGFLGRFVIVSPRFHQIHHSIDSEHNDKNLGRTLIFWDILFGTYADPREKVGELGISQDRTFQMSYLHAQLDWYRQVISYFRTPKN